MMFLCVFFIPPVYFMARAKWGGFLLNSILYGIACLCVLTIALAFVGIPFWALAVGHAVWHLRKEHMREHAELIATKLTEKMTKHQPSSNLPPKLG